jgi:hypothetical protein
MQVETFDRLALPQEFRLVVGIVEVLGAAGILLGVMLTWIAPVAAVALGCVMLGAMLTQGRRHDDAQRLVPPAVLLIVAAIIVALRWSALRGHVL